MGPLSIGIFYFLLTAFIIYRLRKVRHTFLFFAGTLLISIIHAWVNISYYAQVISIWPVFILVIIWCLAIYYITPMQKWPWKIGLYSLALILVILTVVTSLPKYTYTQAGEKVAAELGGNISHAFEPRQRSIGSDHSIAPFIDYYYVLIIEVDGVVSSHAFHPVSGESWEGPPLEYLGYFD